MPLQRHKYPQDWEDISKRIRFERAKGFCEWCRAENYCPHPITGSKVILTVAHIDHDTTNNSDDNLAALCQRCHLNHDRDHHMREAARTRRRKKQMDELFREEGE